jgi:osmotically-inducible protein OsmY
MMPYRPRTKGQVEENVAAELAWNPMVDSRDIEVVADQGAVVLRGTVGSFFQVRQAGNSARRVYGVTSVTNCLRARSGSNGHDGDCELRGAVLKALMINCAVPATVTARVQNGVVCLTGTATWQCQRDQAESACAAVAGVVGVTDQIKLIPVAPDADPQLAIIAAFRRSAHRAIHDLSADVPTTGVVILSGTVTSWAEHDEAVAAGWSVRGVTRVDDRITLMR